MKAKRQSVMNKLNWLLDFQLEVLLRALPASLYFILILLLGIVQYFQTSTAIQECLGFVIAILTFKAGYTMSPVNIIYWNFFKEKQTDEN